MSLIGKWPNSNFEVDIENLHHVRRLSTLINSEFTQPTTAAAEGLLPSIPFRNSYSPLFGVRNLERKDVIPHVRQHSSKVPPRASSSYSTGITVGYDERWPHISRLHRRTSLTTEAKSRSGLRSTDSVNHSPIHIRFQQNPHASVASDPPSCPYSLPASNSIFSEPAALCYYVGFIFPPAFLLGTISRPADGIAMADRQPRLQNTVKKGFDSANAIHKVDWRQRCILASLISGMIVLSAFAIAVFEVLRHV